LKAPVRSGRRDRAARNIDFIILIIALRCFCSGDEKKY
jgi:hypothetical protein